MFLMTDTKEVEIRGVKFKIRYIPVRILGSIRRRTNLHVVQLDAGFSGISAEEKKLLDKKDIDAKLLDKIDYKRIFDAQAALEDLDREVVRFGVSGHENMQHPEKGQIPCVLDADGSLSAGTLELYELNGFIRDLAKQVLDFNNVRENQLKN